MNRETKDNVIMAAIQSGFVGLMFGMAGFAAMFFSIGAELARALKFGAVVGVESALINFVSGWLAWQVVRLWIRESKRSAPRLIVSKKNPPTLPETHVRAK